MLSDSPTSTTKPEPNTITSGGTGGPSPAEFAKPPYASGVTIGETYDYKLYTHCGIHWTSIDGDWWEPSPGEEKAEAPEGWGNPFEVGKMTVIDRQSATFDGPNGDVQFKRPSEPIDPVPCM
jgi:hypothetical protein